MKITIDNFDGGGAQDYTAALGGPAPLTIERKLNQPSRCVFQLVSASAAAPASGARVVVTADSGVMLFTGYVLAAPGRIYAGMTTTGPAYLLQVMSESDEIAFDARVSRKTIECVASTAGDLLTKLTGRATSQPVPFSGNGLTTRIGGFQPLAGKSWSANAGALSDAARASYRVLNGEVVFESVGSQVHTIAENDGTFDAGAFRGARVCQAASDITVIGKLEPQAYVTEIFEGDGVTSSFVLGETPLLEKASLLFDTFSSASIDPQTWTVVDSGGHVSLSSRGITMGGGQGAAGISSVSAVDAVEMGGVLLMELAGLEVDSQGEAYLAGLSSGAINAADMIAGFHARPNGSGMVVAPVVLGIEAGATATLQIGHTYTLRLRMHCKDRQRVTQSYCAQGATGVVQLGGQAVTAGADLVLEMQETTGGAQFPVVVLYDGSVPSIPQSCTPVVIDSLSFLGSIASFSLTRPGEVWVACTPSGSATAALRLGKSAQTSQAKMESTGTLRFFAGNIPAANTLISVCYRIGGRAVARMMTPPSAGGAPSSLIVTAEHPVTRTSVDCEAAALALLAPASWVDGSWKGSYEWWNPQQSADVWPGDLLQVNAPSADISAGFVVRGATIRASSCAPEMLAYSIDFANEWAEALSIKVSATAPENAWLPTAALTAPSALDSLRDLAVSVVNTTQIEIQAGATPPTGGGFEVRRSDWKFGAGEGADLVQRSPVANFAIVRESPVERYYIRMYDGATPPNYSRFSSAVFVNAAMQ